MRLILEICQGRLKGKKTSIAAGEVLRVGRTERSDFVIPKDSKLSGVHFELAWDGEICRLCDRQSQDGTQLDGEAVNEAQVLHGSWIRAGQTDFSVYYEGYTPVRRVDDDGDERFIGTPERLIAAEQALRMLREEAKTTPLYAVLDAARDDRILELVRESVETYASLYEGVQGEKLATAAPYLVQLPDGSRLLEALVNEGWGRRWGIYLTSQRPFREVRRHWRRFLMVELEKTRKRVYFRYYDPHAMNVFWESAALGQRQDVMVQLEALIFEGMEDAHPVRVTAPVAEQVEVVN